MIAPPDAPLYVAAGPLRARLVDGELRYLRLGPLEIVRRIFVTVRDTAWGTVAAKVSRIEASESPDGQNVTFDVNHLDANIDFSWRGRVRLQSRGDHDEAVDFSASFEMDGLARTTFHTNRTGICVLHPPETCIERTIQVTSADGSLRSTTIPRLISAQAIASDFKALRYEPVPGLDVEIRFEGKTFECEDQRNWADGSFKTYCRPLSRPFPYEIAAGEQVRQRVTVHVIGQLPTVQAGQAARIELDRPLGALPSLGLCDAGLLSADQATALRRLKSGHLRVDLRLATSSWHSALTRSAEHAKSLRTPLELAMHLPCQGWHGIDDLLAAVKSIGPQIARWLIYRDGQPNIAADDILATGRAIQSSTPGALVGAGTMGSFAELNRARPAIPGIGLLAWPICPQVHGRDDDTIIESLEAIGAAVETARSFAPGARAAVGPVWFWRRPDPFAAGNDGIAVASETDPRLAGDFAAAWTLGCISALAQARAASITLYRTTGPFGVLDERGRHTPVFHLLRCIGEFAGGDVLQCRSTDPLRATAMAIRTPARVRVWVASFVDGESEVIVNSASGERRVRMGGVGVRHLDLDPTEAP